MANDKKTRLNWILTASGSLTIHFGTVSKSVQRNDPNFAKVIEMLKPENPATIEDILAFLDPGRRIQKHACGLFDVCNGGVYIDGERTPDLFSKRALDIVDLGLDVRPLLNLWHNIKQNPDPVAVKDLYTFLDRRQHPITSDGCFIAYKRVDMAADGRYLDFFTHSIDNSIGATPSMNRSDVDCDPSHTCSRGLHVAALEYARDHYCSGSGVLIAVKVHPKDVCAIPPDYEMTKMRTCGYAVLEKMEVHKPLLTPTYNSGVDKQADAQVEPAMKPIMEINVADLVKSTGATVVRGDATRNTDLNHLRQKRDSNGRFIKKV